ncbi:MAG: LON peptidase substrate-binding domain-containing protein [Hyphomicrobiaceae bacterium]
MVPLDRYRRPADLAAQIPVFPLRGVILLPRATLPLNLFEPRYLAMIEDVIAGQRLVGIVQPERSTGDDESPPGKSTGLRRVGCVGRVTAFQELDDGRIVITLTGVCRFGLGHEVATTKPYRTFAVDYSGFAGDLTRGAGEDEIDREQLMSVLKRYLETHQFRADWKAIAQAPSEHLVNSLSIISPYGPEEKQALLEAADLKTRSEVLVALAEMEMAAGDGGAGSTMQ